MFGSRADGRNGANSDWDVGVEGLPRESWHPLLLALEREFGADRVDLVRVEDVGEALLARIYAGVVLDA